MAATPVKPPVPPPQPPQRPGKVKVVIARYGYTAQHPDELCFQEGDILYVYGKDISPGWWKAKCGDREGLVPENYVEELVDEVRVPLFDAARRGNLDSLREYLRQGVSATSLDAAGNTALYWAARTGHIDCAEELLKSLRVSAIDVQNKMGDTALHAAACHGHLEIVSLLLKRGANSTAKNNDGLTAMELATEKSIKNAIHLSRQRPATICRYTDIDYGDESDESD